MQFEPIRAAGEIVESYKDYVRTTFFIRDEELREQFERELDRNVLAKGPYIDCVDAFEQGDSVADLVRAGILHEGFETLLGKDSDLYRRRLYRHQIEAIERAGEDKNLVITTGTGSGKTEAFLYPIVNHLLKKRQSQGRVPPGVHALLLFPMNALANDQMRRLRTLLENAPDITFGAYTGETDTKYKDAERLFVNTHGERPLQNELISREQMKDAGPNILVTNYAMLEYLLIRPEDNTLFHGPHAGNWKYIVMDEAHTYRGATGMETAMLIRRLTRTLSEPAKIRFFLTSATLGDNTTDDLVKDFASDISAGSSYDDSSIIRAHRVVSAPPENRTQLDPEKFVQFNAIATDPGLDDDQRTNELETIIGSTHGDYRRSLYDVLSSDDFYYRFRRAVDSRDYTIKSLAAQLNVTEEQLVSFIKIASVATAHETKLLDARYHHFIRTIEGAYVTFRPEKTLSIEPRKEAVFDGEPYRAFELSVCQYCGTMYLGGKFDRSRHEFTQSKSWPSEYFMVVDDRFLETLSDEDAEEIAKNRFLLCAKCGSMSNTGATKQACSCPGDEKIEVFRVKGTNAKSGEESKTELHKCSYCQVVNPRGSILRGFYVGQNAAASVIGSSLYEQMPERTVRSEPHDQSATRLTKQLLIFSDNRQQAAFFAPYLEFTYQTIQRRRLIYLAGAELASYEKYSGNHGIPLPKLARALSRLLETRGLAEEEESEREAWKALMYEVRGSDRNGLVNSGLVRFSIDSHFDAGELPFDDPNELRRIDDILMLHFLREAAISVPRSVNFTREDVRSFMFHDSMAVMAPGPPLASESTKRRGHIVHWVAKHNNGRMDFLRKTRRFADDKGIQLFLGKLLDAHRDSFDSDPNGFRIKPELVNARIDGFHSIQWYRCDRCGRLTSFNFDDLCPQFRCDGDLYVAGTESLDGYHRRKVQESSLFPMKVTEHTAQLGHDMAREYQQKFITGEINVLSSSTTFEMGVDVGDLETVFMRNMPPSPANYVQRAGRAGRRTDSAAFALTFCRLANHDLAFFRDPSRMINGKILPPVFKLDNDKIVRRHVYATLLAAFWRQHAELETAGDIFSAEAWSDLSSFLRSLPDDILQYIYEFSPPTMSRETIDSIVEDFRGENGIAAVRTKHLDEVRGIDELESSAATKKEYRLAERFKQDRNKLNGERIIELFSRNNLIPKYGFPIDTVELATDLTQLHGYNRGHSGLRLQRDLFQAITDYAPGSEVIADKQIYTSQYIRLPLHAKEEVWRQFEYGICPNEKCGMLNITPHHGNTVFNDKTGECKYCRSEYSVKGVFIVPEYGFIVSTKPPVEASSRAPSRSGRTDVHYIGDAFGKRQLRTVFRFGSTALSVTTPENGELAVINKSDFAVCHSCGYAEKNPKKLPVIKSSKPHKNPYGQECKNRTLIRKGLGHTFRTDVCMISVNRYLETGEAYSILYAFLEGMAGFFDIDRHDIDGTVSRRRIKSGEWDTIFVLFDKVPGGAGHSGRLGAMDAGALEGFLAAGREVVEKCTCGDRGDGNAACYSCLCNYSNQSLHDILKRKHAIEFYRSLGDLVSVERESSGDD